MVGIPCNAGSNQRWRFEQINTGVFRIHSSWNFGYCLDLPSGNAVSGQDVQLYPCNSGNNQLWFVSASGSEITLSDGERKRQDLRIGTAATTIERHRQ